MIENEVFEVIKSKILNIQKNKAKPIRVAINGIEGTGKTVLANKLTEFLKAENLNAIHVSIDGFHFNREIRYKQGENSAKGYYEDSYDEMAFVEKVLKASQEETPNYTTATHDLITDEYVDLVPIQMENNAVLITDGAYLFKPNYREYWDLKIYLKTSFEIAMNRGIERDKELLGGFEITKEKFGQRYHKSSQMYLDENQPEQHADVIIDNSHFDDLKLLKH